MPVSKVFSSTDELQYRGSMRQSGRCCLDTQRDRDSPAGHAETTHDNSQLCAFNIILGMMGNQHLKEKSTLNDLHIDIYN